MRTYLLFPAITILSIIILISPIEAQPINESCSPTEAWIQVGSGLDSPVSASAVINGRLHALCRSTGTSTTFTYHLMRWDGTRWRELSTFSAASWNSRAYITEYNGEIYVSGSFYNVNGMKEMDHLIKWNGIAWSSVEGYQPPSDSVRYHPRGYPTAVYKGELYTEGSVLTQRSQGLDDRLAILAWNGAQWRAVSDPAPWYDSTEVQAMIEWHGDLYVAGNIHQINSIATNGMYKWDGHTWSAAGDEYFKSGSSFVIYRDDLYAFRWNWFEAPAENLLRWDGARWRPTGAFPIGGGGQWDRAVGLVSVAVHNDELYAIWYDGSKRRENPLTGYRWNGSRSLPIPVVQATTLIEYRGDLYAGGEFSSACGMKLDNIARLCHGEHCGAGIQGTIYDDINSDCRRDPAEPGLRRRVIEISPGPQYTVTDDNGYYRHFLPEGSYTINVSPRLHWKQTCPPSPASATILASDTRTLMKDIAFEPTALIADPHVSMTASFARPGRQMSYTITYENVGTVTTNGSVRFFHDPTVTFTSGTPAPTHYTAPIAQWDFTDLKPEESRAVTVWLKVPEGAKAGDLLCSSVEIEPAAVGAGMRDSICTQVRTSYDPNMIEVTPGADRENGAIYPSDSVLTYTIHFQNTGNDTAFRVIVIDTLSPLLDPRTITLGAASHPYRFSMNGNCVLAWQFDEIMLPDSRSNEPGSHGYLKYSVHLRPDVPVCTQIPNQAGIYFDYNYPMLTNRVISTTMPLPNSGGTGGHAGGGGSGGGNGGNGSSSGVDDEADDATIAIYPNPSRETLHLDGTIPSGAAITLRDLLGKAMHTWRTSGEPAMTLDLGGVPAGTYLLEIATAEETTIERVTVVK